MQTKRYRLALLWVLVLGLGAGSVLGISMAKISGLRVGKNKGVSEESDSFGRQDTVYAAAQIANVTDAVDVKSQLVVEDIPGQEPGPIKGLESTVHMARNGRADFTFSAPTKGWPKGKYGIEVFVLDEHGEELDHKGAEFTVE